MVAESLQQRPKGTAPSLALSGDELTRVIQEASRRQGAALQQDAEARSLSSVDDAFAMAEELGIPEEHVRAALAAEQRKKQSAGGGAMKSFVAAAAGGILAAVGLKLLGLPLFLALLLAALVAGGVFAVGFVRSMSKRYPAERPGPPPVPGTCRVCFRPAHTPQSTFCEEHRYRPPGEAAPPSS